MIKHKMYRKKPVTIHALYWDGTDSAEMLQAIEDFLEFKAGNSEFDSMFNIATYSGKLVLELDTLEGVMSASKPCYILRGIKGEYYICEEEIFKESYEEVNN